MAAWGPLRRPKRGSEAPVTVDIRRGPLGPLAPASSWLTVSTRGNEKDGEYTEEAAGPDRSGIVGDSGCAELAGDRARACARPPRERRAGTGGRGRHLAPSPAPCAGPGSVPRADPAGDRAA